MPRRVDPNVLVRNDLGTSKVNKKAFNARNAQKNARGSNFDRPGMINKGIFGGILLLIILLGCFLVTHFETNRHLKEITTNIDKSRRGLEGRLLNFRTFFKLSPPPFQTSST